MKEFKFTKEEVNVLKNGLRALNASQGLSIEDSKIIISLFDKLESDNQAKENYLK